MAAVQSGSSGTHCFHRMIIFLAVKEGLSPVHTQLKKMHRKIVFLEDSIREPSPPTKLRRYGEDRWFPYFGLRWLTPDQPRPIPFYHRISTVQWKYI